MELFNLNASQFYSFFLTIMRVSIVVFMLPFFGAGSIPNSVKAAFCLVLSVSVWPRLSFPGSLLPLDALGLILMLLGELVLGLVLDIIIRFLFAAVMTGGRHLVGFSMGFAMMNVLDPMTGTSESVTAQLLYQCTILIFLSYERSPLSALTGLAESFKLVPPGGLFITPALADSVLKFSAEIFVPGLKDQRPGPGFALFGGLGPGPDFPGRSADETSSRSAFP